MNVDWWFTPEILDTKEIYDEFQTYRHMPIANQERVSRQFEFLKAMIVETFNAKLKAMREKTQLVYGQFEDKETVWTYDQAPYDTLRARLEGIEEIK
jgi:hypothetical protein